MWCIMITWFFQYILNNWLFYEEIIKNRGWTQMEIMEDTLKTLEILV